MKHETLVTGHHVYRGRVLNLRVDTVRLPDGQQTIREIVEHRGAVAVVALDENDNVLLIKQHRYAVGQDLIELPAGTLEPDESPLECAARELEEETGYRAGQLEPLVSIYPTPGYATEVIHLFIARHLQTGPSRPEMDEYIELVHMPLPEAVDKIVRGEFGICNGAAVVGLLTASVGGRHTRSGR